ncbi:MAG TPA: DUF2264 domain-containing protein [Anaerolineaceae bacterium]
MGDDVSGDRKYWLDILQRLAKPVLESLSRGELRLRMPIEAKPGSFEPRENFTHLEALGRLLAGIAPWLGCKGLAGEEEALRQKYACLARQAIAAAVDPSSPDTMNFSCGQQPIVDAAFLSQAIIRAPAELLEPLSHTTQQQLASALKATRTRRPNYNNWLLFSAMIETALYQMGEAWDLLRVDYALMQHEQWYMGDGIYGDGPEFHWDYYNAFVIQPMMLDILHTVGDRFTQWAEMIPIVEARARRYAAIQERLIAPDGSFPPVGRSLAYRFGAMQVLAQMAWQHDLPPNLSPAQVRSALSAVIHRTMDAPGTFDANGWLQIGLCGHQPEIGETYISTGSLYLCSVGLLPLGLPPEDPFWSCPAQDWTSPRIWRGENLPADHALDAVRLKLQRIQ